MPRLPVRGSPRSLCSSKLSHWVGCPRRSMASDLRWGLKFPQVGPVISLHSLQLNGKLFLGGRPARRATLAATEALGKQPD